MFFVGSVTCLKCILAATPPASPVILIRLEHRLQFNCACVARTELICASLSLFSALCAFLSFSTVWTQTVRDLNMRVFTHRAFSCCVCCSFLSHHMDLCKPHVTIFHVVLHISFREGYRHSVKDSLQLVMISVYRL